MAVRAGWRRAAATTGPMGAHPAPRRVEGDAPALAPARGGDTQPAAGADAPPAATDL